MPFLSAFRPNLILGIYVFTVAEHPILEAMMRVCELCQTAFIAGAAAEWAGWNSFRSSNDRIQGAQLPENAQIASLRKRSEANRIGLVLPRFLLRQAYGSRSDPIETFPFEEIEPDPTLECHLWGNSAFLCGHLMSENFDESEFDAGQGGEVSGLPVQEITREGEVDVKPCAEVWLSEREEAAIRSRGIMPVVPIRGRDAVRVASLHSISKSLEPLPVQ